MLKCFKLADGVQFHQYCWLRSEQVACRFCKSGVTVYAERRFSWSLGMSCLGELGRSIELIVYPNG